MIYHFYFVFLYCLKFTVFSIALSLAPRPSSVVLFCFINKPKQSFVFILLSLVCIRIKTRTKSHGF